MITQKIEKMVDGVAQDMTAHVQQPITKNQRLDRELDSGDFSYLKRDTLCDDRISAPLSNYRITLSDGENAPVTVEFIGTDTRALLRGKIGKGDTSDTASLFRHSVMLTEPTKLLEGVLIDGMAVTQPEDVVSRKSLYAVLKRLFMVASLVKSEMEQKYFLADNEAVENILKNTVSPQFKWSTQTTLWECLCDIGSVIDAIPRLVMDESEGFGTKGEYIIVTFDLINEMTEQMTQLLDEHTIDYGAGIVDDQYNTQLRSVLENVKEE